MRNSLRDILPSLPTQRHSSTAPLPSPARHCCPNERNTANSATFARFSIIIIIIITEKTVKQLQQYCIEKEEVRGRKRADFYLFCADRHLHVHGDYAGFVRLAFPRHSIPLCQIISPKFTLSQVPVKEFQAHKI